MGALPVFPWTDSRSLVTPLMVSRVECVTSYVGRTMSCVSVEPHQDRTGTASAFRVSSGQSPTLMKNSTSGNLTCQEQKFGARLVTFQGNNAGTLVHGEAKVGTFLLRDSSISSENILKSVYRPSVRRYSLLSMTA